MLIKACLNGSRERGAHPALPLSPEEIASGGRLRSAHGERATYERTSVWSSRGPWRGVPVPDQEVVILIEDTQLLGCDRLRSNQDKYTVPGIVVEHSACC